MAAQLDQVTQALREFILWGEVEPDTPLREVALSNRLGVSRTLTRLALGVLAQEGLLVHAPNRGFRTRLFTIDEIVDAVEVRGELEALAVRQASERGLSERQIGDLQAILYEADAITIGDGLSRLTVRTRWIDLNAAFHAGLVEASGNSVLGDSIDHLSRIPLVDRHAVIFDKTQDDYSKQQIRSANRDHEQILDAVTKRQGTRAASLIREHAYQSSRNKRANFIALERKKGATSLPGLTLVK